MANIPATVKFVDEVVLTRPQNVYTGDNQRKHKRSKSCEMNSGSAREYDVNKHQRTLSLQPYMHDGTITTAVADWTPKPLDGTYGSTAMENLCEDFGKLAADIVQGSAEEIDLVVFYIEPNSSPAVRM